MARICKTCGTNFDFCSHCQVVKPDYDAETFCSKEHNEIFAVLSKHGCNLATAEETLEALKDYDTTIVTESIQAHIDMLNPKAEPEPISVVEEKVDVQKPVQQQYNKNKNNKKKW